MNPLSPSLQPVKKAFELKFAISEAQAEAVVRWAEDQMCPDPHSDPALGGCYAVQTLYLDTPTFDVAAGSPGYRRTKHRIRRYGDSPVLYLEQKTRRGDRVAKTRASVADEDLVLLASPTASAEWAGREFHAAMQRKRLGPARTIAYIRRAFVASFADQSARLTLDDRILSEPTAVWHVPLGPRGTPVPVQGTILELKFGGGMPLPFRLLMREMGLAPSKVSKYRLAHGPVREVACQTG